MIFNYFGNIFHYGPWMAKKLVAPQLSITEPCWALTWSPTHHMAEFSPRFRTTTSRVSFPNPHCFFFFVHDFEILYYFFGWEVLSHHLEALFTFFYVNFHVNFLRMLAASHVSIEFEVQGSTVDADPIRVASWLEAFYICLFAWFLSISSLQGLYKLHPTYPTAIYKTLSLHCANISLSSATALNWLGLISETKNSITSAPRVPPCRKKVFKQDCTPRTNMEPEHEHLDKEIPALETIIFRFHFFVFWGRTN